MKNLLIIGAVVVVLGVIGYFLFIGNKTSVDVTPEPVAEVPNEGAPTPAPSAPSTTVPTPVERGPETVLGSSVEERDITAYHYGTGDVEVLFVGGIHGGYSWNTALVAYELMDYLEKTPSAVPSNVTVTVIPVLNPDGLVKVAGKIEGLRAQDFPTDQTKTVTGRFNAHSVDLNRNFDCDWNAKGTWQDKEVSGGARAFSEPESQAIREYVTTEKPAAVIVWYSSAGGVYASNCHNGVLPETKTLVDLYAKASGYPGYESFDYYEITGDMVNWLSKMGIPGISVLLTNHTNTEWEKNLKGIEAILAHYAQ